jgi:hypothetical protein
MLGTKHSGCPELENVRRQSLRITQLSFVQEFFMTSTAYMLTPPNSPPKMNRRRRTEGGKGKEEKGKQGFLVRI